MNDNVERPWRSQDLFCAAMLAHIVTAVAVSGAVLLNASHTFTANAAAGPVQAGALAAIFGAIGLGGAVAAHLVVTARESVHKVTAVITLLIALSVSVLVSLGTQATGRADGSSRAGHGESVAASLQEQRKTLAAELAAMPVSVSPGEARAAVEAVRAKIRADALRKTNDCMPDRLETASHRNLCRAVIDARAILARAERRAELLQQLAAVDDKMSDAGPTRAADPQAENIAWLFSLAGFKTSAMDVGRAVNALTAFLVEAFAILAASLSAIASRAEKGQRSVNPPVVALGPAIGVAPLDVPENTQTAEAEAVSLTSLSVPTRLPEAVQPTQRSTPTERQILSALAHAPGQRIAGSQREMAVLCGVPKSTFAVAVKRLAAAGRLAVDARGLAMAQ